MSEASEVSVAALTPGRLPDLRRVLDPVCGGAGGCFCFNHHIPPGAPDVTGEDAWSGKSGEVLAGRAAGLLAYLSGEPVGWLALDRVADVPGHDCVAREEPASWVVHCFVVVPTARGSGVAAALLGEAAAAARAGGARELLGFPARKDAQLAFAGSEGLFARAGFVEEGEAPPPYRRVRLPLD